MTPPPAERDRYINHLTQMWRVISGPGFPLREDGVRALAGESFDRGYYPAGGARQLGAVVTQPDRRSELARLDLPAMVIHGGADPLVPIEGGRATAQAIPGATFLEIEGMGHSLPVETWERIVDAITATTLRGE